MMGKSLFERRTGGLGRAPKRWSWISNSMLAVKDCRYFSVYFADNGVYKMPVSGAFLVLRLIGLFKFLEIRWSYLVFSPNFFWMNNSVLDSAL